MRGESSEDLVLLTLRGTLLVCARLLGQQHSLDVGQHTSLGNGHSSQKLVQFFVVPDGQLKMAGVDPLLLVVAGGIAGQLKDLSSEVFHYCSQVDWGASSDSLGVVSPAEKTVDSANWELESSTG